jgi:tocopherol O-methyltransferase
MIVPRALQTGDDVAGHYDELDAVYRELWGEPVHHGLWRTGRETVAEATDALTDLVAERIGVRAGDRLCDIGCGCGASAARLAAAHGAEVTGLTLSVRQLAIAGQRPGRLTLLRRDWLANGFADGAFDHAYAIESSEHMTDKQRFFDEAWRTLRPGGRLVACAWLARTGAGRFEIDHLLEPICREGRLPEWARGMSMGRGRPARAFGGQLRGCQPASPPYLVDLRTTIRGQAADPPRSHAAGPQQGTRNRSFALSVPRLILAYRTGAMEYGVLAVR